MQYQWQLGHGVCREAGRAQAGGSEGGVQTRTKLRGTTPPNLTYVCLTYYYLYLDADLSPMPSPDYDAPSPEPNDQELQLRYIKLLPEIIF